MTESMKKFITEQLSKENASPQDLIEKFAEAINEVNEEQQRQQQEEEKKNASVDKNLRTASDALISCAEAMSDGKYNEAVADLLGVDSLRFIIQMALDVTSRELSLDQTLNLMFDPIATMKDIEDIIAKHLKKLFGC